MKYSKGRNASGRVRVELNGFPRIAYRLVRWRLARRYKLRKCGDYIVTLDQNSQKYSGIRGDVFIGWDIWSGFYVTGCSDCDDDFVSEIGGWMKDRYADRVENE